MELANECGVQIEIWQSRFLQILNLKTILNIELI